MEGKRKDLDDEGNNTECEEKETEELPGWQDGGNMTDKNCRIKVYIKCKLSLYNFM